VLAQGEDVRHERSVVGVIGEHHVERAVPDQPGDVPPAEQVDIHEIRHGLAACGVQGSGIRWNERQCPGSLDELFERHGFHLRRTPRSGARRPRGWHEPFRRARLTWGRFNAPTRPAPPDRRR
jgi:hypothetical protein